MYMYEYIKRFIDALPLEFLSSSACSWTSRWRSYSGQDTTASTRVNKLACTRLASTTLINSLYKNNQKLLKEKSALDKFEIFNNHLDKKRPRTFKIYGLEI